MAGYRYDRIAELMKQEIDAIIREDVDDPRLAGTYSVTRVDVTRDLRHAKVFVSVLEPEYKEQTLSALKGAAGFIRRELGSRIQIRYTPELQFIEDQNIEYGIRMSKVIDDIVGKHKDNGEHSDQ